MADTFQQRDDGAVAPGVIAVRGVHKHFGRTRAVDGVDLEIRAGELFGLIGHNGAGKSTLFKMMLGLIEPSAGEIRINGVPVSGGDFRQVRRQVGYLPESVVLYDNLTAVETLQFFARLKGVARPDIGGVLERVGLTHAARRRVREYSKGMRQRLGFAQALLGSPRLLFLDEPTSGLDPEAIRGFYATLRQLRDEGVTVVTTSHILVEIQERVDRLAIMAAGQVQACGTVQALRERMDLPLRLRVHGAPEAMPAIRGALDALALGRVDAHADHVSVECRRDLKMPVIAALSALGAQVRDLTVIEPSLEDVFFGFAD